MFKNVKINFYAYFIDLNKEDKCQFKYLIFKQIIVFKNNKD
jgi:hypothetical protein